MGKEKNLTEKRGMNCQGLLYNVIIHNNVVCIFSEKECLYDTSSVTVSVCHLFQVEILNSTGYKFIIKIVMRKI